MKKRQQNLQNALEQCKVIIDDALNELIDDDYDTEAELALEALEKIQEALGEIEPC